MEELKHNNPYQPEMDFTLFTYKLKDQTMGDAATIAQVDDSPTVGKKNITKLAQQEVEKKLRLGSIEDLSIKLLGLNQNRYHNGELVVNSKHYVDEPEIPHLSYLNDETKQDILNHTVETQDVLLSQTVKSCSQTPISLQPTQKTSDTS